MTNETEKQKTERLEEARAKNVKNTLEYKLLQESVGSNLVKKDPWKYGQIGFQGAESVYNKSMSTEAAQKEKNKLYQTKKQEGDSLGVYGEPNITNYDLSVKLAKQLEEVLGMARVSELEKHAKSVGAKLEFEIPKELKDYNQMDLVLKATNKGKEEFNVEYLNKSEKVAFGIHQILSEAYKSALAKNASQTDYFADINAQANEILNQYGEQK